MQDLWFIAILPNEEVSEKAEVHRRYAAEHFNAKHALKSFPHITLFPPFKLRDRSEGELKSSLHDFFRQFERFEIRLKDFGSFKPRAIFINVEENRQLEEVQAGLKDLMHDDWNLGGKKEDRKFRPHLTIAHRDLDKDIFGKAWKHFKEKEFSESFTAKEAVLLRHDGKHWQVWERFALSENP